MISPTFTLTILFLTLTTLQLGNSRPTLNSVEQDSLYHLLESLNSAVNWRSLFPDDLCSSAPHGVVCNYFNNYQTIHITELNFGYVSDYNPNPTCTPNSTLPDPNLFSSFPHLHKLFFYNCFVQNPVLFPDLSRVGSRVGSGLEELVFIDNPAVYGSLSDNIGEMINLRRLIITGTGVSGEIPAGFGELSNLEEVTLSGNGFSGELPEGLFRNGLKKLKVLDLSYNELTGELPESIGGLESLLKLDLSFNGFSGELPATMEGLTGLELLDLSENRFGGGGVPLFLGKMGRLKGVFLSGNELGGMIPDIWEDLRGVEGIGLSRLELVGEIPSSMGVFLGNVRYLGLDNNKLTGLVPREFEKLGLLSELDLRNNSLSGRVPFSADFVGKFGGKMRLDGNPGLCVDEGVVKSFSRTRGGLVQVKVCNKVENPRYALLYGTSSSNRVSYYIYYLLILFILLW